MSTKTRVFLSDRQMILAWEQVMRPLLTEEPDGTYSWLDGKAHSRSQLAVLIMEAGIAPVVTDHHVLRILTARGVEFAKPAAIEARTLGNRLDEFDAKLETVLNELHDARIANEELRKRLALVEAKLDAVGRLKLASAS